MSEQAIIKTGGKQYRISKGEKVRIDRIEGDEGAGVEFDQVLFVGAGDDAKIGTPIIAGAKVSAEIVKQGRGPKLIVYKFRRRKNYRRKRGHRQHFTEIKITGIAG
ncbi:MAG: 50S ribosomal protein L21 [Nannocystaceae bacterium]